MDIKGHDYPQFEQSLRDNLKEVINGGYTLFYATNPGDVWETYINNIEPINRQHYNCNCCKSFVRKYGLLVYIDDNNMIKSAIWNEDTAPKYFKDTATQMRLLCEESFIDSVFYSDTFALGNSQTNSWNHLSLQIPISLTNRNTLFTARQLMAKSRENYKSIARLVNVYSDETVNKCLSMTRDGSIYRGSRFTEQIEWLKKLKAAYAKSGENKNVLWKYLAKSNDANSQMKNSVIGSLMSDIEDGVSTSVAVARFTDKVSAENYMRAKSDPGIGNIERAEAIVSQLGLEDSLVRRYARFDEIPNFLWKNKTIDIDNKKSNRGGIFGVVEPKVKKEKVIDNNMNPTVMTWSKFERSVLPYATNIEALIESYGRMMSLVTEGIANSKQILQWDNPFSWYYKNGVDGTIKKRVEGAGGQYEDVDLRCSLAWNTFSDLDLHCRISTNESFPTTYHLYFGNKRSVGGYLDVDMNVSPDTNEPVENIRWTKDALNKDLSYEFYVNNFTERSALDGNEYTVELDVFGKKFVRSGNFKNGSTREETVFTVSFDSNGEPIVNSGDVEQSNWGVSIGEFVKVKGITTSPNMWGDNPKPRNGEHMFFLLDGCADQGSNFGRGLFSEMMIGELREVRKTIEAYMSKMEVLGREDSSASGLGFSADSEWNLVLRATIDGVAKLYRIDRLD